MSAHVQVHCLSVVLFATRSSTSTDAVLESAAHVWHCSDCSCIFCIEQLWQSRHMLHVDFLCDVVACEFVCISPDFLQLLFAQVLRQSCCIGCALANLVFGSVLLS